MRTQHQKLIAAAAACIVPATCSTGAVLDNDFSADTLGLIPASMDVFEPTANTADLSATVVTSSVLDGNALRLIDNENTALATGNNINIRQATSESISAGIFSLDFTAGDGIGSTGNTFFRISVGSAGIIPSSSSSGTVFQRVVISSPNSSDTGTIAASNVGGGSLSDTNIGSFDETVANALQIVFNNSGAAIDYDLSGAQSVADNTYDVFLNGVLIADDFQLRSSSGDIEAIGFGTGGGQTGADWVIDNLSVAAIPEPASAVLAAVGCLALCGRRRRNA